MDDRDLLAHFRPRLCPECGYDLRGSPSLNRCPECGFDIEDALLVQPSLHRSWLVWGILGVCAIVLLALFLLDRSWYGFARSALWGIMLIGMVWFSRPRPGFARDQTALLFTRSGIVEYRGRRKRRLLWSEIAKSSLDALAPIAWRTKDGPVHKWQIFVLANTDVPRLAGPLDMVTKGIPDYGRLRTHFHATISQGNALRDEIIRRHANANCDDSLTPDA